MTDGPLVPARGASPFWSRLRARLKGEESAEALEAYRRAGGSVYELLARAEGRRADLRLAGKGPWTADRGTQAFLALSWNAFALQLLGDTLLEADYEADPTTVGFVPAVTAEQILRIYSQVPGWLGRASQAESDPQYHLDVHLPAELPPWHEVEPCPTAHLTAMRSAASGMRRQAEAARADFMAEAPPTGRERAVGRVSQLFAEATARSDYADRLWVPRLPLSVHPALEAHLKVAVEAFYQVGQVMSMPTLADQPVVRTASATAGSRPGPGSAGFDRWSLTDPDIRTEWSRQAVARRAIDHLWKSDPDPKRTLAVQSEIDGARERGDIDYARDGRSHRSGHYYCCPWSPIYVVKRPVVIGGRRLRVLEQFVFDVSGEEMEEGGDFKREILVADFRATTEVDYCLPGS